MSIEAKISKSGNKLVRSEITTVRLDPKLRYLAELAARKQRRTLSSYIEWAVEMSLDSVALLVSESGEERSTFYSEASKLWDVDESERFIKLAIHYRELLTHEEQEIWKALQDSWLLTPAKSRDSVGRIKWNYEILDDFVYPQIRQIWSDLKEAHKQGLTAISTWAKNERELVKMGITYSTEELEKWEAAKAKQALDDDIPF